LKIEEIRKHVDDIDENIIALLNQRKQYVMEIGTEKKTGNKPIIDLRREKQVISKLRRQAKEHGLDEDFIESLFKIIIKNSRQVQK
jgi:chorismate mutase